MGNKKKTPKKSRQSEEEAENGARWDRSRLVSTALFAAGVAVFAAAVAAAMAALRRNVIAGERFECGPPGMEHLSDAPAQGLHVLTAVDVNKCDEGAVTFRVTVAIDGFAPLAAAPMVQVSCAAAQDSHAAEEWLFEAVRQLVEVGRPRLHQRLAAVGQLTALAVDELGEFADVEDTVGWGFFTPYGTPLPTPASAMRAFRECGTLYVVEGGVFVWPGIRIGHNITLPTDDPYFGEVTMTTLSLVPRVFTIEPLLTQDECEWIVETADKEMEQKLLGSVAKVDSHLTEKPDVVVATEKRTSTQARLPKGEHPVVAQIEQRAHRVLRVPDSHGEPLQVVRYRTGERYGNHHDYFDPDLYQKQPGILKMIADGERQRVATLLWYIAEPEDGGETHFPRAGGLPNPDYRLTTCPFQDGSVDRAGVIVPPRRGECYMCSRAARRMHLLMNFDSMCRPRDALLQSASRRTARSVQFARWLSSDG